MPNKRNNLMTGVGILMMISSIASFAQDSAKRTHQYGKYLNLSIGMAKSRLIGSMIDRQTRRNDDQHISQAGLFVGFSVQSDVGKNFFTDMGFEMIGKRSEYKIPSQSCPAKAATTFLGIPMGIGYRLINDPGATFQVQVGGKVNYAIASKDNLEDCTISSSPVHNNLLLSYYIAPQFRFRINAITVCLLSYRFEKDIGTFFSYHDAIANQDFTARFESNQFTIGVMSRILTWNKD
jgi:Outer membrane protein beta-barrel domain